MTGWPPEFVEEAEDELREAAAFYEGQRAGLGARFVGAVERAAARAAETPLAAAPLGGAIRRQFVVGFPYVLIFRADRDSVRVLAVAHLSRRPGYWRGRQ